MTLPVHLEAGTRLGPYEIVSPIGAGGMGEVYRTVVLNWQEELKHRLPVSRNWWSNW